MICFLINILLLLQLRNKVKTIGFKPVKVERPYFEVRIRTVRWMSPNSGLMKLEPYELKTVLHEECMERNGIYVADYQVCTYERSQGFYLVNIIIVFRINFTPKQVCTTMCDIPNANYL